MSSNERPSIEIAVSEEISGNAAPEFDWFANSSPVRNREGSVNRLLRRFGMRLVRTSKIDRDAERRAKWGQFASEDHHHVYGRPWFVGRDYFDVLASRGLRRNDRLLDFGCGAMRAGIWIAAFLDDGKYFGIDSHRASLDIAATYEIPLHALERKQPVLLHSSAFRVDSFNTEFDVVFCASVFRHLEEDDVSKALRAIRSACHKETRLIIQTSDLDPYDERLEALKIRPIESFVWTSKFSGESPWTEFHVG